MYNYKLTLKYDGSRYDGWMRLGGDSTAGTIEMKLIQVIEKMAGETVEIYVGCRTEKGVHAICQVANFKLNKHFKDYEVRNYLNRYLPRDIAVMSVEEVDERFHSQLNAKEKTYLYRLDVADVADVFNRHFAYHTFQMPDIKAMRSAAKVLEGEHDFKFFTTAKKSKSTVRRIKEVSVNKKGDEVLIRITANDFLHNMARLMIGVLLDVGNGIRKPEDVEGLFNGSVLMSLPAESYALFLENIEY
ncbi:MAG: tRNA pseudouridine(38-40) synthase TruA [Lachnospira sp.]